MKNLFIGLMSGTSVDSIDSALVNIAKAKELIQSVYEELQDKRFSDSKSNLNETVNLSASVEDTKVLCNL